MDSFIFADSFAIKDKGVECFKSSKYWPVAEEEFQKFGSYVFKMYEDLMFELDDNLFDIALIDYKFQSTLLQILHYNYVKNYANNNNVDILCGNGANGYLNPDWIKLGSAYSLFNPYYNKLSRVSRRIVKNIFFNKHLRIDKVINSFILKNNYISIGSSSSLKVEYIIKNKICCDYQDSYDILDFKIYNEPLVRDYQNKIMDKLVRPYLKAIKSYNHMYIDGINMLDIEACYARRFKEMIPAYVNILKSNNNNNRFLVTEAASLMNRILIVGYQRIGCKVFGFHHGGDFAATITNQTHKGAMSHCKNLIVPNKGIADQYKKTYSQLKLESIVGTKYQSLTNKKLFFKDKEKLGLDRDIKNVMLMGFPMSCQRRLGERGLFFLSKIEIEYKIMEMLKKIGLNVLYKAHPDRGNEVNGIFDGIADRIVYDTFEKSWEMADAFIFTYTSTTTFDLALKTDKKIILIDVKTNLVDECLRSNLHKRVDYVPATINSNDFLINFDKNILKNCVFDNHTTHNDV